MVSDRKRQQKQQNQEGGEIVAVTDGRRNIRTISNSNNNLQMYLYPEGIRVVFTRSDLSFL